MSRDCAGLDAAPDREAPAGDMPEGIAQVPVRKDPAWRRAGGHVQKREPAAWRPVLDGPDDRARESDGG